jgi:hypothetical protein
MPFCGMNVMVERVALPHLYYAPMGPDSGVDGLHRFGDIWMGCSIVSDFATKNWSVWTGTSVVVHTRASDARKNLVAERLGVEMHDRFQGAEFGAHPYFLDYERKRRAYGDHVDQLLQRGNG